MICCDVQLPCGKCKQDTLVHLDRTEITQTGFGCITCGTAEKKGEKYVHKEKPIV